MITTAEPRSCLVASCKDGQGIELKRWDIPHHLNVIVLQGGPRRAIVEALVNFTMKPCKTATAKRRVAAFQMAPLLTGGFSARDSLRVIAFD